MMIPVRYWLTTAGDLPLADLLNSSNFMFWRPGPDKYFPNDPPKGWVPHLRKGAGHLSFPYASYALIKEGGAKAFLRRRALQLPRSGGEYLALVKIEVFYNELTFNLGLAHYRHRGPTSPLVEFPSWKDIPERIPWLMHTTPDIRHRIQRSLPERLPCL